MSQATAVQSVQSTASTPNRSFDLACVNLIPRWILGLGIVFSGLSRFTAGYPAFATAVGITPYADALFPASVLLWGATLVCCIEIVLGILLLIGFRTRQCLIALGVLVFIVTIAAGVTDLTSTGLGVDQSRPDGSGVFGPTGMSITFLKGYTYPLTALILFLLLLPAATDRYSLDGVLVASGSHVSDTKARSLAILLARAMVGLLWFVGGINKVFLWGAVEHARMLFVIPYARTFLPTWSLWASGTVIPYLELIFPALVIVGLWTRPSLYILGGILILVSFGHLLLTPHYLEGLEPFILARAVLLLLVLMFPREADIYSVDHLISRR